MPNVKDIIQNRYSNELNIYNYFNPYRIKENVEPFMGGLPIVFMTTPSMNIFSDSGKVHETLTSGNQLFALLEEVDPYILKQLQYSNGGSTSPFIKLTTNRFKGISLKDFSMDTVNEYENYYGWQQILPKTAVQNYTAESSLSVTFSESKNLDMTKLFYSWISYMEATRYGLHEPSDDARKGRILDFTSSIYFFLLDFDMRTILYWCKYTGVFPINVPLSSLIMSDITSRSPIDTSITFVYQYKEELNPQIFYDFNIISSHVDKLFNTDSNNSTNTLQDLYGEFFAYDPNKDKIAITGSNSSSPSLMTDDGRDYLYNKKYDRVNIRTMIESNYNTESQTAFNSEENTSKKTFVMEFSAIGNSPTSPSTATTEKAKKYASEKYDNIRRKLLSSASDIMGELAIGLIGSASEDQYNEYLEERKKALRIDDKTIDVIKDSYKTQLDDGIISQEEYDRKIETLQTDVDKKLKDNSMDYNTYKTSSEYKNSVRAKNYLNLLTQANKIGKVMPSMTDWIQQQKNDTYNKASSAVDSYLKFFHDFGGTI